MPRAQSPERSEVSTEVDRGSHRKVARPALFRRGHSILGSAIPLILLAVSVPTVAVADNETTDAAAGGSATGTAGELGVTGKASETTPARVPPPDEVEAVELDRLLQLPSSMSFDEQTRNGASSDTWRARFRASFAEIRAAEDKLDETKKELDRMAGTGGSSQWQMAPPGASNTEVTPMSYKLREEMRAGREALELAEQKHRELEIQADLAGVPAAWRKAD